MSIHLSPLYGSQGAQTALCVMLGKKAAEELKVLIETRHLYQKVSIHPGEMVKDLYKQIMPSNQDDFAKWVNEQLPKQRFILEPELTSAMQYEAQRQSLRLKLPQLSIFCKLCGRREAFAPVWNSELLSEIRILVALGKQRQIDLPEDLQLFSLVYQCQRCLGTPEGFLVRREGWTLSLHGRSPMERIEVPTYLPKLESKFYRDALIAFNTGKTLAALFYLRTFIEQFARRITSINGRATGDEILDAYYKTLPTKHADHLPSLRDCYDNLSDAIHGAREDVALFEAAKSEIESHFDMRRVFKMTEQPPNNP